MNDQGTQHKGIRCARFEIVKLWGDDQDRRKFWLSLSDACKEMTNILWDEWSLWHYQNDSRKKLRAFHAEYRKWRESKQGKASRPSLDVYPVSAELQKRFGEVLNDEFAWVHSRVRTLLINQFVQLVKHRKASNGSWSGWHAIILGYEGRPNMTRRLPIPYDKQNCPAKQAFIKPDKSDQDYKMQLRLDRFVVAAKKYGKEKSDSTVDVCSLKTTGRKCWSQRAILDRIVLGVYEFKGSKVFYDETKRKWFALVSYEMPQMHAELDTEKTLMLWPGANDPWIGSCGTSWRFFGGRGNHVAAKRRILKRERRDRQENYKWASSSGKGHGRRRGTTRWQAALEQQWKNYCKRYNNQVSGHVVKHCVSSGIGNIVLLQPAEGKQKTRFLANAGADTERQMGWDFFQFATMLKNKGSAVGIKVEVRKCQASGKLRKSPKAA